MRGSAFLVSLLIFLAPTALAAACREKPEVQMDERSGESHLVAKKNPELPPSHSRLLRLHRVVVVVTVDREGAICDAKAVRGPEDLRGLAVSAVKKHWKYRPFLVDWEPVVAQFPVSVTFVRLRAAPELRAGLGGPCSAAL